MQWIKRTWLGEEKLWMVFWIYGVVGGSVVQFLCDELVAVGLVGRPILVVPMLYDIWASIVIWKCASNTNQQIWGTLARSLAVLSLIGVPLSGFNLFFGSGAMPSSDEQAETDHKKAGVMEKTCDYQMTAAASKENMDVEAYKQLHAKEYNKCKCVMGVMGPQFDGVGSKALDFKNSVLQNCVAAGIPATDLCQEIMTATAQQAGADPQKYIADNQPYLQQCVEYYNSNASSIKGAQ